MIDVHLLRGDGGGGGGYMKDWRYRKIIDAADSGCLKTKQKKNRKKTVKIKRQNENGIKKKVFI
jgi:hypothetical protein